MVESMGGSADVAFHRAGPEEMGALLPLMRAYYADDHLDFDPGRAERALRELFGEPARGEVWLIRGQAPPDWIGYYALFPGFSLEYGGRAAFIDELFVKAEARCRGIGTRALTHAAGRAAELGCRALRLETTKTNARAHALYRRAGFADHGRSLLVREFPVNPSASAPG